MIIRGARRAFDAERVRARLEDKAREAGLAEVSAGFVRAAQPAMIGHGDRARAHGRVT